MKKETAAGGSLFFIIFNSTKVLRSCEPFPRDAVDLFHDFADFVHHVLTRFALGSELHEADLLFLLTEVYFPAVLLVLSQADPSAVGTALEII